ncbi:MAG: hypothetical protein JO275_08170 [Verrucomicrobia bacterium]|nr:hypothetical protein [Verrucomicrobiota bacterium]
MKVKLDENIPASLKAELAEIGHDVHTGRAALIGLLKSIFERYDVENWKKCFVVVSETKIRIQRN